MNSINLVHLTTHVCYIDMLTIVIDWSCYPEPHSALFSVLQANETWYTVSRWEFWKNDVGGNIHYSLFWLCSNLFFSIQHKIECHLSFVLLCFTSSTAVRGDNLCFLYHSTMLMLPSNILLLISYMVAGNNISILKIAVQILASY